MGCTIMLTAIRLYDQPCSKMYKIGYIRANRLLTPEFFAIQSMRPQLSPQFVLAVGHLASQLLGEFPLFHFPLSPTPLPQGERGFCLSFTTL